MISHCRSRAYPRDIRFAASRNIIAAQRTVWYRRWLIRWMMIGSAISGKAASSIG